MIFVHLIVFMNCSSHISSINYKS